jgi:hypothetical protein
MRLRVPELLAARQITAYQLANASDGRISMSAAYRLANGDVRAPSLDVLAALCDVFGLDDAGPLFDLERKRGRAK